MSVPFPSPTIPVASRAEVFLGYLDYFRSQIVTRLRALPEAGLRSSRLPSGWTPLDLVKHLVYMERRWLRWGFLSEDLPDPFGDQDRPGHWAVGPADTAESLVAEMLDGGRRTRAIVTAAGLDQVAPLGGRFQPGDKHPPPTLLWILMHVFEEYARHAGHLDVARELADGMVGES